MANVDRAGREDVRVTLPSGTRLGPYEIVALLGAGGMGEVHRARDTRLGRDVAIKVLPAEFAADRDRLRRFEQEARAVAALNHPNILAIHDIGSTDQALHYLVTELLEGETVAAAMAGGRWPVSRAVDVAAQIVKALAAAHAKQIVHRDLKPANVFLTTDGQVKLLDFGIAKLVAPAEEASKGEAETATAPAATDLGTRVGTVGYMAPEQVRGLAVDGRADIFAFGAVLYEMLAGRRAFESATAADTLAAILTQDPDPLTGPASAVPPSLQAVVTRCLEKRPDDRFQSAKDLGFALQAVGALSGSAGVAPAVPSPAPRTPQARRWKRWAALAGALLLAAIAFAGLRTWFQPRAITSLAVLPFKNDSGEAEQDLFADAMMDALISDLGQIKALEKVTSRTSAMTFKGTTKTLPEIAEALRVQGIVEGAVLRDGNSVRVTVRLIDARQERRIWTDTYVRATTDVITLQREMVRQIASQIRIKVTPRETGRLSGSRPVDPAVYDWTVRAANLVENGIVEQDFRKALAMFQSAVDRDPRYAPAWAGLGYATFQPSVTGWEFVNPKEVMAPAIAAVEKALALDPDLPEAHFARASMAATGEWDLAKARTHYETALELRPGYAVCHTEYAQFLLWGIEDLDKAGVHLDKARELDPFSPFNSLNRVWYLNAKGHPEQAVEEGRRLFEAEPLNWTIPYNIGFANLRLGNPAEAVRSFEAALKSYSSYSPGRPLAVLSPLGLAYGLASRREEAQKILTEFERASTRSYVSPVLEAYVHIGLGQNDEAFRLLEHALDERIGSLLLLSTTPCGLDTCFKDPRWPGLKARIRRAVRMPERTK